MRNVVPATYSGCRPAIWCPQTRVFISFADPVLPDVTAVLAQLERDGVTVKILTGDNDLVARHVCRSIALTSGIS